MLSPSIVCVGSTMVDLVSYLDRMPAAGETVFGQDFARGFGGKGANQAVMAALLGADVVMVNTVGADAFGREIIANLESSGVDVEFVEQAEDTHSGVATILVEQDGQNRIVLGVGGNARMTESQVERAFARHPSSAVVIGQLEIPQPITRRAFSKAKDGGAITVLNPGPAAPLDAELLALTDWLIPNETEFALVYEAHFGRAPRNCDEDALTLARAVDTHLIVTLGERGANLAESNGRFTHFSAPEATAVDTTGAGDAFCGTFAYGLASGWSTERAIRLAIVIASTAVTRRGTQPSYPRGEELSALIAAIDLPR